MPICGLFVKMDRSADNSEADTGQVFEDHPTYIRSFSHWAGCGSQCPTHCGGDDPALEREAARTEKPVNAGISTLSIREAPPVPERRSKQSPITTLTRQ